MKQVNILFLLLITISCSTTSKYEFDNVSIEENGDRCFNDKTLKEIFSIKFSNSTKTSNLFINPIIADNSKCIGLYGFVFKNLTSSSKVITKVLKYEDHIYVYSKDKQENERALQEFLKKYSKLYSEKELKELEINYRKGTEIQTRLY